MSTCARVGQRSKLRSGDLSYRKTDIPFKVLCRDDFASIATNNPFDLLNLFLLNQALEAFPHRENS